jgi:hypothetical protein
MGFQIEGITAALVDLGRYEEAFEALGASDVLSAPGYRPRDTNRSWAQVVTPRIEAAREALGGANAESAYARGAAMSSDHVVAHVLALAEVGPDTVARRDQDVLR